MKLTIPHTSVETRSTVVWTQTLAEVVKVERSSTGFKTATGTTRPCFECRDQVPIGGSGVEPWPMATWLLHAEVFGTRSKITLPLCSDHFKELRDEERNWLKSTPRSTPRRFMYGGTPEGREQGDELMEGWEKLGDPRLTGTYEISGFRIPSEEYPYDMPPDSPPSDSQTSPPGRA